MCRAVPLSSSVFPAASALSAPTGHLPLEGKALSVVILFFTYACIRFDVMGKAVFSYRSLPHWGRGTASAVDRVLSYNACLRRIFHLFQLSFMPLEPYPARYARHLPLKGKADDARETCCQEIFGHRPIYICGEAATTTLNPEPQTLKNLVKQNPLTRAFSSCIITSVVVMNYVY